MEKGPADSELLEKVKVSDMEAFRLLFERYQPIVFRHVLACTRETELSHDIVQETFVRIWERRSTLKPRLSFIALAFRISGNLIRDAVRRRRTRERLQHAVPPEVPSEGDDPEERLQLTMLEERILDIIAERLPEKCRTIFILSRFESKPNREIAEMLGLSVRTVEHQISHALNVLRKNLEVFTQ